jgi:hypothetical protein
LFNQLWPVEIEDVLQVILFGEGNWLCFFDGFFDLNWLWFDWSSLSLSNGSLD